MVLDESERSPDERKRRATELHDHLQQMLVLAKSKLDQAKWLAHPLPACAGLIGEADDVLCDALAYTRTLVDELSPPNHREAVSEVVSGNGKPAPAIPTPIPGNNGQKVKVLLVDDHAMMRQGLRGVLDRHSDLEVIGEASNGEEAVALVEPLRPSVILMDINMPKMNGIKATAHIKAHYPGIAIIGLSVNADGGHQKAMKTAGAAALLRKEAAVEDLYLTIQQAIADLLSVAE